MDARADLPSVCIIGAGPSGIAVCKSLFENRIAFDCFDAGDRVGGNWVLKNASGMSAAFRSLHTNTSRDKSSFSDFPMPATYPTFPHHEQIAQYIDDYVEHFGFRQNIRLQTRVEWCNRLEDGTWEIALETGETRYYDFLCVANGHHWDPRWPEPEFPGNFIGDQFHSHDYIDPIDPIDCVDKDIVVVGMGNSALDIACELGRKGVARTVYLSSRRGYHIVPKYIGGRPLDHGRPHPTESGVALEGLLPRVVRSYLRRKQIEKVVGRPEDHGLPKPDHAFGATHPTISDEIHIRVGSGDVIPKPTVRKLLGDRIQFVDGTEVEADIVIYATGYKISFPFFDRHFLSAPENDIALYKRMLDPQYDNLVFVGLVQPLGAIMPIAEAQSLLVADYVTGRYALPTTAEMNTERYAVHEATKNRHVGTPRHTLQIDCNQYVNNLSTERKLGAKRATLRGNPLPVPRKAHRRSAKAKKTQIAAE